MELAKKVEAYNYIKEKIINLEFKPLSDISEDKLIDALNTSRTPIRQALQQLSNEQFVYIYPRKGTIVADIPIDMVQWVYDVREMNEPYITANACGRISEEWLCDMRNQFYMFSKERDTRNMEDRKHYIHLDRALHDKILSTCDNPFVKKMMENVFDHSQQLRVRTSMANKEYVFAIEAHIEILEALLAGNMQAAEKAAKKHLIDSRQATYKYFK